MIKKIVIYGKKSHIKNNKLFVSDIDFQMPFGYDSFKIPIDKLNEIEECLISGKKIPELFQYSDFSLWWFIHPTIFPKIKQEISFIIKFQELLDKVKPSEIKIHDDFMYYNSIKQICTKKKIPFSFSNSHFLKYKISTFLIDKLNNFRYKLILKNKIKKRKNLSKNKISYTNIHQKILFAIPTIYRREITNLKTSKSEKGEYIQDVIIKLLEEQNSILGIDLDYTFQGDLEIFSERLNSDLQWIALESLLIKNNQTTLHNKFFTNYKKIISQNDFQSLFNFDDISIWKSIENTFNKMVFSPYIPFYLILIDSLLDIFEKYPPKTIFLPYETGPYALAFILAANKFNIQTIGIAHAIISSKNPMYSYQKLLSKKTPLGFPIPTNTLVFGNYSKQMLINSGYPENQITVFGNAAFFNLDQYIRILKNQNLQEKYKINKNKKIL